MIQVVLATLSGLNKSAAAPRMRVVFAMEEQREFLEACASFSQQSKPKYKYVASQKWLKGRLSERFTRSWGHLEQAIRLFGLQGYMLEK